MKIFIDTNVLISAAVRDGGLCSFVLEHCLLEHEVVLGEEGLAEFRRKLLGKFGQSKADVDGYETWLRQLCQVLPVQAAPRRVSRDPQDDWVVAAALASHCACVITGDKDLLVLGRHEGLVFLKPAAFLEFGGQQGRRS